MDYLQLIGASGENRQLEVAEISNHLKNLAKDMDIPVVVLSQLNKATEHRAEGRPRMADIRDSSAIEQDADIVLMLYHPGNYQEGADNRETELIIDKHRNGQKDRVNLIFAPSYATFRDQDFWEPQKQRR